MPVIAKKLGRPDRLDRVATRDASKRASTLAASSTKRYVERGAPTAHSVMKYSAHSPSRRTNRALPAPVSRLRITVPCAVSSLRTEFRRLGRSISCRSRQSNTFRRDIGVCEQDTHLIRASGYEARSCSVCGHFHDPRTHLAGRSPNRRDRSGGRSESPEIGALGCAWRDSSPFSSMPRVIRSCSRPFFISSSFAMSRFGRADLVDACRGSRQFRRCCRRRS